MTAPETAGQALDAFHAWMDDQYPDGRRFEGYGGGDMRDAFEGGMHAQAAIAAAAPAADPFGITHGFRLITDNSGTRHLVDVGGVRYLTEDRPGSWELAIRSGNWPALVQLARNIMGTTGADL